MTVLPIHVSNLEGGGKFFKDNLANAYTAFKNAQTRPRPLSALAMNGMIRIHHNDRRWFQDGQGN